MGNYFSAAFEHPMLRVWEIYALGNVVLYIAVYWAYKPIYATWNVQESTVSLHLSVFRSGAGWRV